MAGENEKCDNKFLPGDVLKQISGRDSANLRNTLAGCEEAGICYRNIISETSTAHKTLVQQSSFNSLRNQNVSEEYFTKPLHL